MAVQTQSTSDRNAVPLQRNLVEAWSEGYMVGSLVILILITCANMKPGVLLHKLILVELVITIGHGTFDLIPDPTYSWYLSSTAVFLYLSYTLHNVVAWIKTKPFLPKWGSRLYIGTIVLVFPYWVAEMYFNFAYFNLGNLYFQRTRPWEALARDPWWLFTSCFLIYIIKRDYDLGVFELVRASPRFAVLITCIGTSLAFIIVDVVVTAAGGLSSVNPYWKIALVFKCAADALFLDDFKKVLDQLTTKAFGRFNNMTAGTRNSSDEYTVTPRPSLPQGNMVGMAHDFSLAPMRTTSSSAPESSWKLRQRSTHDSHTSHVSPRSRSIFSRTKPSNDYDSSQLSAQVSSLQKPDVAHIDAPFAQQQQRRPTEWFDVIDDISSDGGE